MQGSFDNENVNNTYKYINYKPEYLMYSEFSINTEE